MKFLIKKSPLFSGDFLFTSAIARFFYSFLFSSASIEAIVAPTTTFEINLEITNGVTKTPISTESRNFKRKYNIQPNIDIYKNICGVIRFNAFQPNIPNNTINM